MLIWAELLAVAVKLEGAVGEADKIEIVAKADFVESARDVAIRETEAGAGGTEGAS